jgi:uncharacterized protein YkwD
VLVVLGALALAPASAQAVVADTASQFPAEVTVGQTGIPASIVLTNLNNGSESFNTNNVCNVGSSSPCDGATGITLVPSCALIGEMTMCDTPDPGVFQISATATGALACAGMTVAVTDIAGPLGAVLFTPVPTAEVTLPGNGAQCRIDFTLHVLKMPAGAPLTGGGVPTSQLAEATQYSFSSFDTALGTSSVIVHKAQPTIATTASPGVPLGAGALTDTATVSGRASPVTGATVQFKLYAPGDTSCASPISTTAVPLSAAGTATSPPFTPAAPGTYRWIAAYSGDANNAAVSGACNDPGEAVTVTARATPTIAVGASPGIVLGGKVFANAVVGSRVSPAGGATVVFRLFGPDDAACLGAPPVFAATVTLDAQGAATAPSFAAPAPGVYRWIATYGGDANNLPVASACGAPGSTVRVAPLPPQIVSAGFASPPRVGQLSFLTVGAFDPSQRVSGLQVRFGEPRGLSGISACRLRGLAIASGPIRLRLPYIFRRAGRHRVTIVVLSGGCSGKLTTRKITIFVDVAAAQPLRQALVAKSSVGARAARSACANTFMRPTTSAVSRLKVATAILCLVNVERAKKGLHKLQRAKVLALAATAHSKDMLKRHFFEHAGPGGPSLQARLKRVSYRGTTAAENIAYGSNFNAKLVVQAWMNSPPHKANILAPRLVFLGVGIAVGLPVSPGKPGSTYTQDLGSTEK